MQRLERLLLITAAIVITIALARLAKPFAHEGFPSGHDATAHITYTFLFDRALGQGQVPVRWVEWVRSGESQPLFNFYPPGLYYLIETVHLVVPRLSTAFKSTVVLAWWGSALLTFLWLRPLGWMAAAFAAVIFAWSPYVLVDVFIRAAYPEVAAMALVPGLLWSVDRVIRRARIVDALLVACFVCAMLLCHLLSSLIFAPIVAAYGAHRLVGAPGPLRRASLLAAGAAVGVGMATFYLLPSMAELSDVAIGRMTSGYSDYQQHFVAPSQWLARTWGYGASVAGLGDEMPLQIGVMQWLAIAFAIGRLTIGALIRQRVPHGAPLAFWLAVVLAAMFLMTDHSAFLWRAVPALAYLQFPWRYFMAISLGTAALAGLLLASVPGRTLQALLVIAAIGWQYQAYRDRVRPLHYFPRHAINIDSPRWPDIASTGVGAFLERGFTPVAARREAPPDIGRWTIVRGSGDVYARRVTDDVVDVQVTTAEGMRLRINSHHFPGWLVRIDEAPAEIAVDADYGFLEVTVPPGAHLVEARFTNTPVRTLANTISLVSVGVWGVGLGYSVRVRRREAASPG